ncbi:MAG TPA: prolyl oligopeptidase family serine peptidase, partial [Kofleriaceae bacterium]
TLVGSSIITNELRDAHSALVQYDLHGAKQHEIALPTVGSSFVASGGPNETEAFGFFSSFAYPGTPMRIDLATGAAKPWVGSHPFDVHFDPNAFETKQVFVTSKDGTKIPMFITAKRGLAMDNAHSVLLTGYGFGGISLTPYFHAPFIAWLERGGVLALVNVRGGGEYGEKWHDGGKLANEQNKFDDFNAAAAWLANNHIAAHARIGAIGTSGGGMLVGAAVVQHPELYGAMFPIAGVLDLLRFQLFGEGAGWQADPSRRAERARMAARDLAAPQREARELSRSARDHRRPRRARRAAAFVQVRRGVAGRANRLRADPAADRYRFRPRRRQRGQPGDRTERRNPGVRCEVSRPQVDSRSQRFPHRS